MGFNAKDVSLHGLENKLGTRRQCRQLRLKALMNVFNDESGGSCQN